MDFIKLTDTGLKIATRHEIYEQLAIFARASYGNDISLDDGTPFNAFLQMLADGLSTVNGSTQAFSELFSTKELSGNFLDFVAGQRGIVRKSVRNQRVTMTATVDSTVIKPFLAARNSIFVEDNKGRTWVNTSKLMIQGYKFLPDGSFDTEENFQGTCEFGLMPLTGYDADLLYANNYPAMTPMNAVSPSDPMFINHFEFINKVNATPAVLETETDAQLRARYDAAVYSNAAATVDGLRSNLLKLTDYVRIVENFTNSASVSEENPYGLDPHSVWCIVGGNSTYANYGGTDPDTDNFYVLSATINNVGTDYNEGDIVTALGGDVAFKVERLENGASMLIVKSIPPLGEDPTGVNLVTSGGSGTGMTVDLVGGHVVSKAEDRISTEANDTITAQTILNYKSLGCGVSTSPQVVNGTVVIDEVTYRTGNFMVEIPVETMVAQIPFTRLVDNTVTFAITLYTLPSNTDGTLRNTVRERVSFALQEYVAGLQPGEPITRVDTVNAIQGVLSQYEAGKFDFVSSTPSYSIGTGILIYQKAIGGTATVNFSDE